MSADGNIVAIGSPDNDGTAFNAGHVRIYSWSGSAWVQKGLDIDGEAYRDKSGSSVSLSSDGSKVAIGATSNDGAGTDAGHTRIYEFVINSCTSGSIIYNTATGKFNFCEDGLWVEK